MYVEREFPNQIAVKQNFALIRHSEVKFHPEHQNRQQNTLVVPELVLSLTPLAFIFTWAVFLLIWQKIRSNLDSKIVYQVKTLQKVPCKNCKYFSNNHYLKCAVNPDSVLTEEAVDCAEYLPKPRFPHGKIFN